MSNLVYLADSTFVKNNNFTHYLMKYPNFHKTLITDSVDMATSENSRMIFNIIITVKDIQDINELTLCLESLILDIGKINLLYASKEQLIQVGGQLRSKFGIDGITNKQAELVRNKFEMKQKVSETVEVSPFMLATTLEKSISFARERYPVVLKPVDGLATASTHVINNEKDLVMRTSESSTNYFYLEEFIPGEEYHCDSVVQNNEVVFTSISKYLYNCIDVVQKNRPLGSICFPRYSNKTITNKISAMNKRVIETLGLKNSVCHSEFFIYNGDVRFGEIAARIGGGSVLPPIIQNTHGIDIFEAMIDIEMGMFEPAMIENNVYTGMICFPSIHGQIKRIPSVSDFSQYVGVLDIKIFSKVGDIISDTNDTKTRTGVAFVEDSNYDSLKEKLLQIYNTFCVNFEVI